MKRRLWILFLTSAALLGQTNPTIRVTTRLVEVNVIAGDKNGPTVGLTKEDFTVYDNGNRQEIAVFEMNSTRTPAAKTVPLAPNEFANRTPGGETPPSNAVMFVWDMLNTHFSDQIQAREQVLKSIRSIRPGDRVGLYVLNSERSVLQDFTGDSSQLEATLRSYAKTPDLFKMIPPQNEAATMKRAQMTLAAAREISSHLAHVPGRKSVVWISGEAPPLYGAPFAVYMVDARGLIGNPPLRGEAVQPRIEHEDGSVTHLPIPAFFPNHDAMRLLAESTGGMAFVNTNNIRGAVSRAIADADVTYTLAFYPNDSVEQDRRYHHLKIEVKRRGVELRYRNSYQSNPYTPRPELRVADALASVIDSTEIGLAARLERTGTTVRIPVTIAGTDLGAGEDGRRTGQVEVLFVQRSEKREDLDRLARTLELNYTAERYQAVIRDGLRLTVTLEPKPGMSEVKIVVLDRASGRIGSLTVPVEL